MSSFYLGDFKGYNSYEDFKDEYAETFGCGFADIEGDGEYVFDIDTPKDLQYETIEDILEFGNAKSALKFLKENKREIEAGYLALKLVGRTDKRDETYFDTIATYECPISASKYNDDTDEWEDCDLDEYWDSKKNNYDWAQIDADGFEIEYEVMLVTLQFGDWDLEVWEYDSDGDFVGNVASDFDIDFGVSIPVGITGDIFSN